MYFKDHPPPHIHLIKNEQEIVYTIDGEYLHGKTRDLDIDKLMIILNRNNAILKYNWKQMQGKGKYVKLR